MPLGQNDRTRGRQTNRGREPNPLTRSYDSHGPDVRIRGTAQHVAERYLQLARDAHTGNDPVATENYLQHAEHYFRLIGAAEAAQFRIQSGDKGISGGFDPEDMNDDDDGGALPDRFSSSVERPPQRVSPEANFAPPTPPQPSGPTRPLIQRRA